MYVCREAIGVVRIRFRALHTVCLYVLLNGIVILLQ